MVYNHIIHPLAESDVQEAIHYYTEINPDLAIALLHEFEKTISDIKHLPLQYQRHSKAYRKANLSRFPYKVIFKVKSDEVLIVALAHHKRKPNYWKKRK